MFASNLPDAKVMDGDHRKRLQILVVDDNPDIAESTVLFLSQLGYEADAALSGNSALGTARRRPPQVAFLDISMPGMNGFELARKLREMFPDRRLWLIAITARDTDEDCLRCHEAGFDLHFTKPADPSKMAKLLSIIERLV